MTGPRVVVVGDALLDVDVLGTATRLAPDSPVPVVDLTEQRPRPGGAALAAALAAADDLPVTLVTALGDDQAGATLRALLAQRAIAVYGIGNRPGTAVKRRVRVGGQSLLRLDNQPGPIPTTGLDAEVLAGFADLLAEAAVVLVADYGSGLAGLEPVRAALAQAAQSTPMVWDPHPRGQEPVPGTRVVTPNMAEALHFLGSATAAAGTQHWPLWQVDQAARQLAARWAAAGVCITLGEQGALLSYGSGTPLLIPASPAIGDPCGAGDALAARLATMLARGAILPEAVESAVRAAAEFAAAGGAAGFADPPEGTSASALLGARAPVIDLRNPSADPVTGPADSGDQAVAAPGPRTTRAVVGLAGATSLARRVHARGGTVVATGGCFDLLHAGHLRLLRTARAMGDCLVVLLNSDSSVNRIKGPGRPVLPAAERAELLAELGCVDAVATFDEDNPEAALGLLRPDIWVKGADYGSHDLPEAEVMARWGGRAVRVPYLTGHSTSALLAATGAAQPTARPTGAPGKPKEAS